MGQGETEEQEAEMVDDRQGLGQSVAAEEGEMAGSDTEGGGASGAPAHGVRRKRKEGEEAEEEGEEGKA